MIKRLTPAEQQTDLWKKIKSILEERLELHRKKNDSSQPESDTAKLRGRIAEVKFLLDLDSPEPALTTDADD